MKNIGVVTIAISALLMAGAIICNKCLLPEYSFFRDNYLIRPDIYASIGDFLCVLSLLTFPLGIGILIGKKETK